MRKTKNSPKQTNLIHLFKHPEETDIIASRLHSISHELNRMEYDETLDIVHTKVLEAIDWYSRYCDDAGFSHWKNEKDHGE